MIRDVEGNQITEGDRVWFPLALGQIAVAGVQKITAVIQQNQPPTVQLTVLLDLPVMPNGLVPGIVKVKGVVE